MKKLINRIWLKGFIVLGASVVAIGVVAIILKHMVAKLFRKSNNFLNFHNL